MVRVFASIPKVKGSNLMSGVVCVWYEIRSSWKPKRWLILRIPAVIYLRCSITTAWNCMDCLLSVGVCWVVQGNWRLEIMGKFGAELMRRSKQWRQAVGDGWNEVRRFWRNFRRKPTVVSVAWRMIKVRVGEELRWWEAEVRRTRKNRVGRCSINYMRAWWRLEFFHCA